MRRLKPVSLTVKNIGRDGKKTTVTIPLKVDSGRQPEKSSQENNKGIDSPEEQDVPVHDRENQPSTSQQQNRVLSTSVNWEKVREKLLNSYIEEQQLPDNVICVNCQEGIATTRCEYCGPHQYFCVGCARALHGSRNKFHILEQWKDGVFVPLYPDEATVGYGHACKTSTVKLFRLLDASGQFLISLEAISINLNVLFHISLLLA